MSNRGTTRWQMRREAAAVMSRAPDFRAGYSRTVSGALPLSLPESAGCRLEGLTIRGATDASGTPVAQSKSLFVTVRGKNLIDYDHPTKGTKRADGYVYSGYCNPTQEKTDNATLEYKCAMRAGVTYRFTADIRWLRGGSSSTAAARNVWYALWDSTLGVNVREVGSTNACNYKKFSYYYPGDTRWETVSFSFTPSADADRLRLGWYQSGFSGVIRENSLQVEEGTVSTPIEPYYEDSITVPLPHPLAYGSSVDLAAGVMNTNYLSFVPNEARIYASDDDTITLSYYDAFGLDENIFRDDVPVYVSSNGTVDCYVGYQDGMYYHCLYVTIPKDSTGQTVEDWLSAHLDPIYIYPNPHRDAISHKEVIEAPKLPRTPVGSAFVQIGRGEPETTATVQYRSMTKEATT